jgi:hypothetical protein
MVLALGSGSSKNGGLPACLTRMLATPLDVVSTKRVTARNIGQRDASDNST